MGMQGQQRIHVLVIKLASLNVALLVVVGPLENRTAPFSQQPLGHSLDAGFWLLAPCVEQDDLADSTAQEGLLFYVETRQSRENIPLDVVGGQRAVVERFQKELDMLQEVCVGVEHGMLYVVAVQQASNFGE